MDVLRAPVASVATIATITRITGEVLKAAMSIHYATFDRELDQRRAVPLH